LRQNCPHLPRADTVGSVISPISAALAVLPETVTSSNSAVKNMTLNEENKHRKAARIDNAGFVTPVLI
jgi:hypothetical protein